MLVVKTTLGPSKIHGTGCFASELIVKDALVWRFVAGADPTWKKSEILKFPRYVQSHLYHLIWKSKTHSDCYVLHGDGARYINSSDKPNLKCWESKCKAGYFATAARNIEAGEELTWNYLDFDLIDLSKGNLFETIRLNCNIEPDEYDDFIESKLPKLVG